MLSTPDARSRLAPTVDRLFLGSVVSNGGDRAIMEAQLAVSQFAFGGGETFVRDSSPSVVEGLVPGVHALPLISATRLRGPARRALIKSRARRFTLSAACNGLLLTSAERQVVAAVRKAGLVAYSGGTSLIEKYPLSAKFDEIDLALRLGRPTVLMPQSLGPFLDPLNQERMRTVCSGASAIFLRDQRSRAFLEDIGASMTAVEVVPDIVFWMVDDVALTRIGTEKTPSRPRVAISVRDCTNFFPVSSAAADQRRLEAAYGALIGHIVGALGGTVTLVSTCQGVAGYWLDDSVVAARVYEQLSAAVAAEVVVDRALHSTDELRAIFGRHDLAVSTRLHGAILALTAGTPVLPIAYEFKTHEVFDQLGASVDVLDIADAEAESMSERFDAFVARVDDARPGLKGNLEQMKVDLLAVPQRLAEVVGG